MYNDFTWACIVNLSITHGDLSINKNMDIMGTQWGYSGDGLGHKQQSDLWVCLKIQLCCSIFHG